MVFHKAIKVSKHLQKGGHIPYPICPLYQYDQSSSQFLSISTLQKQPRTLKCSMDFEYRQQLESEYPDLRLSALNEHKSDHLRFQNHHNSDIITPLNIYRTLKLFGSNRWKFGGHAFELSEVPHASDMSMSDSFSEVCLCGESNTGKSSLVNTLMGSADFHHGLALVSKRPGRTRVSYIRSVSLMICVYCLLCR